MVWPAEDWDMTEVTGWKMGVTVKKMTSTQDLSLNLWWKNNLKYKQMLTWKLEDFVKCLVVSVVTMDHNVP